MPYLLFFEKAAKFLLLSAANYRWRFKGFYSKTRLKRPLKKIDKTKVLMANGSLMTVKSIAECSYWPALSIKL